MAQRITEFMLKLSKDLKDKKNVTESTADAYIRTLVLLNNKAPFKNLLFIKKIEDVLPKLSDYAISTRKNIIATIASVLSLYKDSPTYKKAYEAYSAKLKEFQSEQTQERGDTLEKTEKEEENWIEWSEVEKVRNELKEQVNSFKDNKNITTAQYDVLLSYLILCLFTYVQPRRNQDYQAMFVVRQWTDKMPTDKNYLDLHGQRFIFNVYKTAKSGGQQVIEIPDSDDVPLKDAIVSYLKHNAHYKASKNKATEFRFLTKADGTPLTAVNAITRILNRLFGRKIGSSMLRHSFLSNKYGSVVEEMKEDAGAMAHSMGTQKTYIRAPKDGKIELNESIDAE